MKNKTETVNRHIFGWPKHMRSVRLTATEYSRIRRARLTAMGLTTHGTVWKVSRMASNPLEVRIEMVAMGLGSIYPYLPTDAQALCITLSRYLAELRRT